MSQLHKRLEHLVNYSSQLIFVSSDSIADQQRTLSEFLSLQHESTEVSFFSASKAQDASDYRRIICRQLANHTVGSFVRPLRELLQDLDDDKGHYLVCISQAEMLDATFLNELWDWVTSCREHQQDLHINIILFAEQIWTERAQTWLPSHHINKPVLLSSQSIDAVGFDVSALENLMAQKRAFFAVDDAHNIIQKKWFIVSVLSLFLLIFLALIALQYPEQTKYFIETGELPEIHSTIAEPAITIDETNTEPEPSSQILPYEASLELIESDTTDSIFVSNWPSENNTPLDDLLGPSDVNNQQIEAPKASTEAEFDQASNVDITMPNRSQIPTVNPQDFAVDDIVSVAQLDQQLQQELSSATSSEGELEAITVDTTGYLFDEALLLSLPQNQVLLQLSGIQNRNVLTTYLAENNLASLTWVYKTQRYGGDWFVVVYKQAFDSIAQATAAIAQLPPAVQQSGPFSKRVQQIQQEILQR
ncbi:SPOR domain-containing protein [Glaciecola sp. SC05]|uniref:SPOR domain-containing protein n=1 Tax=Glaciecola sp. SC05 TaxID=1987355 RepID=UPI003526F428